MKKKLFFSRFTQRVVTSHTHEMCFKSHLGSTFYFFVRSLEQLRQKCSLWRSWSLRQRELSNLVVGFYHQVAFFWQTIENIFTKTTVLRSTLLCFDCEFWSKTFLNSYIGNPIDTVTSSFSRPSFVALWLSSTNFIFTNVCFRLCFENLSFPFEC